MFNQKKTPSKLTVTDKIISYGGQSWAVRNITTVGKYKIENTKKYKFGDFAKGLSLFSVAIYLQEIFGAFSSLVIWGSGFYLLYAIWYTFFKKPKFGFKLVSAAGESELFVSDDEGFIDKLVREITKVIQSDEPSHLSINIDNSKIYDNLKNVVIDSTMSADRDITVGDRNT